MASIVSALVWLYRLSDQVLGRLRENILQSFFVFPGRGKVQI